MFPHLLLIFVTVAGLLILALLAFESIAAARAASKYPAPGRMLNTRGGSLHVRQSGTGEPAVVLEAGIGASSLTWALVEPMLAAKTTVFSYDRFGLGWTPESRDPLTVEVLLQALHDWSTDQVREPFVLCGHSFGALLAQLYADRFPERVAGLMLIDPPHTSEWSQPSPQRLAMLDRGVSYARRGAVLARLGFVRAGLHLATSGASGVSKRMARVATSTGGERTMQRLIGEVRKMPPETWPAIQAHWSRASLFRTMAAHLRCLPEACALLPDPGNWPRHTTIISGGHLNASQLKEHRELARTAGARHVIAAKSAHWVQLDEPDLVTSEILRIVDQIRAPAATDTVEL